MKKSILAVSLISAFAIGFSGCGSTPEKKSDVSNEISVEYDKFKKTTNFSTPLYLSRKGFTDRFPVKIAFRASYKQKSPEFIQIYVTRQNNEWGFFRSATGEDGTDLKLRVISNDVERLFEVPNKYNDLRTVEHFALDIDKAYLEKMSKKNWEIKVYGKKASGVFTIPSQLSQSFLERLNCHEEGKDC